MTSNGCATNYYPAYSNTIGALGCKERDESNNLNEQKIKYYDSSSNRNNEKGECDYLYYFDNVDNYSKKNIYDRWVTTIVFGCFIFLLDISIAIFGFLIFKDGDASTPL